MREFVGGAIIGVFFVMIFSLLIYDYYNGQTPIALSPTDRVSEEDILVTDSYIRINVSNASWASFTDTNSMIPTLDIGSNSIEIDPKSEDDIFVGDIISFRYGNITIVHRIIEIKNDSEGKYFVTKGDNNIYPDPVNVRFPDIGGVVIAIIY